MPQTYSIHSQVYYNNIEQCYRKIITIDRKPVGPLQNIVKSLNTPKLSPFQESSPCCPIKFCSLSIYNPYNHSEFLSPISLPLLISYLQNNGYTIEYNVTNTLVHHSNDLIFYISY